MQAKSFLIGIYDEDALRADLLHNKLEQLNYGVAFSCCTIKDLLNHLGERPALLFLGTNGKNETIKQVIRKIRKLPSTPKIIHRISGNNKTKVLSANNDCTTIINSTFRQLWDELTNLMPEHPMHQKKEEESPKDIFGHSLKTDHPFYDVINDSEKYLVLKLSAKGKSSKEIAAMTGMNFYHVEALRKQIIRITKSNNITEAAVNAKEMHLI